MQLHPNLLAYVPGPRGLRYALAELEGRQCLLCLSRERQLKDTETPIQLTVTHDEVFHLGDSATLQTALDRLALLSQAISIYNSFYQPGRVVQKAKRVLLIDPSFRSVYLFAQLYVYHECQLEVYCQNSQ